MRPGLEHAAARAPRHSVQRLVRRRNHRSGFESDGLLVLAKRKVTCPSWPSV